MNSCLPLCVPVDFEGTFDPHPSNYTAVLGDSVMYHSAFETSEEFVILSWTVTLANDIAYNSASPSELRKMMQLGIVISGGNVTLPARVDMNGTIVARKAYSEATYEQIFSYTGSLTVQGINVIYIMCKPVLIHILNIVSSFAMILHACTEL